MMAFTTSIVCDLSHLKGLAQEWIELWQKCTNSTPFQRPEWLLPWAETFCPNSPRVVQLRRDGELVGLAPMFLYQWHGENILAPLGAGITDYLDWLVSPDVARHGIATIFATLDQSREKWDRLDLPDLPAWSTLLNHCDVLHSMTVSQEACPAYELPASVCGIQAIPERQRKNLRTARNRTRRAGEAGIEIATTQSLPEFLDALFRLHSCRWQQVGMPGMLSEQNVHAFHQRSAPQLLSSGMLRLYGLRFQDELIAVLHTLYGRDSVYCYLQGFDPAYAFFSPGAQITAAVIEDAAAKAIKMVDFLRGREPYKYGWGARDRFTSSIQLSRQAMRREPFTVLAA